ncbi:MAG: MFS transporter [Gammaproteobacteria bacterium]
MTNDRRFLGFIRLTPGVMSSHAWTLLYGAFFTIGLLTFVGIGTPLILNQNLGIPLDQQGDVTGTLGFWTEIAQILLFVAVGVTADRVGRRSVYALGMLIMGLAYVLYPLAESIGELTLYRVIYAAGVACAAGMLATVVNDYPKEQSRGKMIAVVGILNGMGVVVVAFSFGSMPEWLLGRGVDAVSAARFTYWAVAFFCVLTAVVLRFGLQPGTPVRADQRPPALELAKAGLRNARNPRIALAYAAAFVARSDLVVLGLFTVLWGNVAAMAAGMEPAEATSVGRRLFGTAQIAALLWAFLLGPFLDRFNRVSLMAFCMGMAAIGYIGVAFVEDPLAPNALPLFALLGIGQISAFFGATTLIGQEAPLLERGAVIGVFNFAGAIGILFATKIGGVLFDTVDPSAPFVMIGCLNLLIFIAAMVVRVMSPGPNPRQAQTDVSAT